MTSAKSKSSFAESFAELEAITTDLERDDLDLDDAVTKFERGLQLAQQLKTKLSSVEQRVEAIRKKFSSETVPDTTDDRPADEA